MKAAALTSGWQLYLTVYITCPGCLQSPQADLKFNSFGSMQGRSKRKHCVRDQSVGLRGGC